MKHSEKGESIWQEENEVIARGFGSRMQPEHLRHSALQEMANEKHSYHSRVVNKKHDEESVKILCGTVGCEKLGDIKILGNNLKRDNKGILRKL